MYTDICEMCSAHMILLLVVVLITKYEKDIYFVPEGHEVGPSAGIPLCLKSKCTDFLLVYLLDLPEITRYLLRSMTLGKIHSGSVSSTDHSSTGSHFP